MKASILLVLLFVSSVSILFFWPIEPLLTNLSFSKAVYAEKQHLLRLTLSQDEKYRLFTPLTDIAPTVIAATLLQEDRYFYWHPGINPFASLKAFWQTYFMHKRRIGASTLTMQVARMHFHIYSKTLAGKLLQMLRAIQLEMHYSKKQILTAYLNLAPYGNNIEGIGAASLIYFTKPARDLTLPEALTLCVMPQNPLQRTPQQPQKLQALRNKLFLRWVAEYPQDKTQQALFNLPLQLQTIKTLPFLAPHFVNSVLHETPFNQSTILTTLNLPLQNSLTHVVQNYLARKKNLGVHNAAILLVDTRDMSIKSLIGSANFFNPAVQGQINGTQIKRSPGSTLKPFIYALALDQGLIHPYTMLKDTPQSFGSYNPENFDYDFMGPIKAKDALILSRNIPAITLAEQLATPNLYQFLTAAAVSQLQPAAHYGLGLALGNAELTMQELVSLYAMLTNAGKWQPLRMRQDQPLTAGIPLLSPEASFLVLDMLKDTPPPAAYALSLRPLRAPLAWKTGTSSGYRDAWSVGVVGPYVLAVWLGNFTNQSNPALVGKNIAAPLLFELVEVINREQNIMPNNSVPLHLTRVAVCKASGMLPTRYCQATELTWFIPGKSPIKTDTIYREVAINKKTGLRTCEIKPDTTFAIYEFWPSDLNRIFKQAGIERRTPPPFEKDCAALNTVGIAPQIISPQTQVNYIVRTKTQTARMIPLTAIADAEVNSLYWFMNATYVAKTRRDEPFLWAARPGKFVVRVVDDHGRADVRDVVVKAEN